MIIRWLGAYGKKGGLLESLSFELSSDYSREVCAEEIKKGQTSKIKQARVGLLVKNSAVIKKNSGDVWSVYDNTGKLVPTRKPVASHNEVWAFSDFVGVVVQTPIAKLDTVKDFCADKKIPLFKLSKGGKLS